MNIKVLNINKLTSSTKMKEKIEGLITIADLKSTPYSLMLNKSISNKSFYDVVGVFPKFIFKAFDCTTTAPNLMGS